MCYRFWKFNCVHTDVGEVIDTEQEDVLEDLLGGTGWGEGERFASTDGESGRKAYGMSTQESQARAAALRQAELKYPLILAGTFEDFARTFVNLLVHLM